MSEWAPKGYRIPWALVKFSSSEAEAVKDAVASTWISGGPQISRLEQRFKDVLGVPRAIAVANGTVAIQLVLRALNIGPGDEVIVPDFAFVAAASQTYWAGATPVLADVEKDTWCLDPNSVRENISPKTKAVISVHTYGNVCNLKLINGICEEKGIFHIEDSAESLFSRDGETYAGCSGTAGTFSFHATKTITTGEGGLVVCRDEALYDRMVLICNHGMTPRGSYWHVLPGSNFRMTNMQAALGMARMNGMDSIIGERKKLLSIYRKLAQGHSNYELQRFRSSVDPVVWTLGVKLNGDKTSERRAVLMNRYEGAGIEVRPGFHSASEMPEISKIAIVRTPLSRSTELANSVIALPFYPGLQQTEAEEIMSIMGDA
jgi:perosamine synthetase